MTDLRFLELHSLYMTRHYRAALYLLGDRDQAARAAEESWLACCIRQPDPSSDEEFAHCLCAALLKSCQTLPEPPAFAPEALLPAGKPGNLAAAQAIGALPLPQRQALVLGSVCKRSLEEIALLLSCGLPQARELLDEAQEAVFGVPVRFKSTEEAT